MGHQAVAAAMPLHCCFLEHEAMVKAVALAARGTVSFDL